MAFQSSIPTQQAAGIVGELAFEGPLRAQPAVLASTDAANNVIGRAFRTTKGQTGSAAAGSAGAADPAPMTVSADTAYGAQKPFAGILSNPKVYAQFATPFAASVALPNGTVVELVTEGDLWVLYPAACKVGDIVYFLDADGTLVTAAPGAAIPNNSHGPIGTVERFDLTGAGIGVLHLEPVVRSLLP